MGDVWRVTVGDVTQESDSFTPLAGILQKLCNRRQPFKVGFGKLSEATLQAGTGHDVLAEAPPPPDDF